MAEDTLAVPAHVEETVAAIVALHASHYERAHPVQRFVATASLGVARPLALGLLSILVVGWVAFNLTTPTPFDAFPFQLLSTLTSVGALYVTLMILIARRLDDDLQTRRDQLTLELAILSEQKSAKIIELLEIFRRNDPNQGNHRDELAEAMSKPADPEAVLEAIRAAHDQTP